MAATSDIAIASHCTEASYVGEGPSFPLIYGFCVRVRSASPLLLSRLPTRRSRHHDRQLPCKEPQSTTRPCVRRHFGGEPLRGEVELPADPNQVFRRRDSPHRYEIRRGHVAAEGRRGPHAAFLCPLARGVPPSPAIPGETLLTRLLAVQEAHRRQLC